MVISTSDKVNKSIRQSRLESMRKRRMLLRSQKRNQNKTGYQKRTTTRTDSFKPKETQGRLRESKVGIRHRTSKVGILLDRMDRPVRDPSRLNRHHHKFFHRKQQPVSYQWGSHPTTHPKYIGNHGVDGYQSSSETRFVLTKQYNSNPALQGTGVIDSKQNNWWASDGFLDRF